MTTEPDIFDSASDATRADCIISRRPRQVAQKRCEIVAKPKRKRVKLDPQQQRWFEANGYTWARVEVPNAFAGVMVDLWGCYDYIAVKAGVPGVLFVQVTTKNHLAHRRRKILAATETAVILATGNQVQIHAWSQPSGPGSRWIVEIEDVS